MPKLSGETNKLFLKKPIPVLYSLLLSIHSYFHLTSFSIHLSTNPSIYSSIHLPAINLCIYFSIHSFNLPSTHSSVRHSDHILFIHQSTLCCLYAIEIYFFNKRFIFIIFVNIFSILYKIDSVCVCVCSHIQLKYFICLFILSFIHWYNL